MGPRLLRTLLLGGCIALAIYGLKCVDGRRARQCLDVVATTSAGSLGLQGVAGLALSPDFQHLYVLAYRGDSLAVYCPDLGSGEFELLEVHQGGEKGLQGLRGGDLIVPSPDGRFVYAACAKSHMLVTFARNPQSGLLTYVAAVGGLTAGDEVMQGASCVAVSPNGRHVYVSANLGNSVVVFQIDSNTGTPVFLEAHREGENGVAGLSGAYSVLVSADGRHVYVSAYHDKAITVFKRDSKSGRLSLIASARNGRAGVEGLDGVVGLHECREGTFLYAASEKDNAVVVFARDVETGVLSYIESHRPNKEGNPPLQGAALLAGFPGTHLLLVTALVGNSITAFRRDPESGTLSFLDAVIADSKEAAGLRGAYGIAVDPVNSVVYVGGYEANALTALRLNKAYAR
ncbi:MAG: beta-propeller fold lactonase family protein [Kiritimatiellae bacterium]|nr:beta-propeller fold lactonase family protein [Kiritimatiellia bacterium]